MPPFIVTLTTMMFFSGLAIWITTLLTHDGSSIGNLPQGFAFLGQGRIGGIPFSVLIALAVCVAAHVALSRTLYGRWLFAIGVNPRAAEVSGVPVRRVVFWAYVISRRLRRHRRHPLHRPGSRPARRCWASASCSTSSVPP